MEFIILFVLLSKATSQSTLPQGIDIALETSFSLDPENFNLGIKTLESILDMFREKPSQNIGRSDRAFTKFVIEAMEIFSEYNTEQAEKTTSAFSRELLSHILDPKFNKIFFDPEFGRLLALVHRDIPIQKRNTAIKEMYKHVEDIKPYLNKIGSDFDQHSSQFSHYIDQFKKFGNGGPVDINKTVRDFANLLFKDKRGPLKSFNDYFGNQLKKFVSMAIGRAVKRTRNYSNDLVDLGPSRRSAPKALLGKINLVAVNVGDSNTTILADGNTIILNKNIEMDVHKDGVK